MQGPAVADYPAGAAMSWRVIDDVELVWMLRGQARFHTADGALRLPPGDLLLVPPGLRHRFVWDEQQPSRHGFVHLHPDKLGAPSEPHVRLRRMTADDPLAGLCAYLLWLARAQPDDQEARTRRALRYLLEVLAADRLPADLPAAGVSPPLARAVAHLRQEWAQMPLRRITVAELASAAAVSRGYLTRRFRTEIGTGVGAALEDLRFSRVELLLVRTDLPLSAVAHHCGFADRYHFSHRFRARYGTTPSAYRAERPGVSILDDPGVRQLAHALWG